MSNIFENVTPSEYFAYLKTSTRNPIYKIELLDENENPYKTIEDYAINASGNISGSLNNGVRRTSNISFSNSDKRFNDIASSLNIKSKYRIFLGDLVNGKKILYPQGTYVFDDPKLSSQNSNKLFTTSGTDKFSILNGAHGGILEGTYSMPLGSKISDIIRSILALSIVNDKVPPLIDPSLEDVTLPYAITKSTGDTVSDILLDIAFTYSSDIYYNAYGALVLEPYTQNNQKGVYYGYELANDDYNYIGASKKIENSKIFNSVVVIADNVQNSIVPIRYEAINNDLTDMNSVPNVGVKKVHYFTDYTKGITTTDGAERLANWILQLDSRRQSSINLTSVPLRGLNVDDVITLKDEYVNSDVERMSINSYTLPIGTSGTMNINATKAKI